MPKGGFRRIKSPAWPHSQLRLSEGKAPRVAPKCVAAHYGLKVAQDLAWGQGSIRVGQLPPGWHLPRWEMGT